MKPPAVRCCQYCRCARSQWVAKHLLMPCVVIAECMMSFFPPFHLKQNATDSSSNSSQKREQPVRTLASPASCEHRRICTRGHLHDHYSSDHYHLEQVRFLPSVAASVSARVYWCLVFFHMPKRQLPPSALLVSFSVSFKWLPVIKKKVGRGGVTLWFSMLCCTTCTQCRAETVVLPPDPKAETLWWIMVKGV